MIRRDSTNRTRNKEFAFGDAIWFGYEYRPKPMTYRDYWHLFWDACGERF